MAVQHARKNKEQEEDDLDLKNRRAPKTQKEKALKEVNPPDNPQSLRSIASLCMDASL